MRGFDRPSTVRIPIVRILPLVRYSCYTTNRITRKLPQQPKAEAVLRETGGRIERQRRSGGRSVASCASFVNVWPRRREIART